MSRRLAEATEEALLEGGRSGRKAIEDAGFSNELRDQLLEKVEAAKFRAENAAAFAEVEITSRAGQGTRDIASAAAWTGTEASEDTMLRMLNDARKPLAPGLRGPAKIPTPGKVVDLRLQPKPKRSSGQRLANARDRTSIYAISKDANMSEKEREAYRKELKDRFGSTAGVMPNSFRGLAALANERIEDAIARGQFKNIPRGKGVERDARADNPFIDTTEYIMNKMIKRQDIVPPWIEKQQELVKTANNFRGRMRHDWKRHVARTISSRGGSLSDQVKMAELYARAEAKHNPKRRAVEQISVPTNATDDPVMVKITQEPAVAAEATESVHVTLQTKHGEVDIAVPADALQEPVLASAAGTGTQPDITTTSATPPEPLVETPLPAPFRDPAWEATELSYFTLAVQNLNSLTRSYNLMAPDLAKKPYFMLDRELKSCYADVAPQVAQEIIDRARRPERSLVETIGHSPGGVMGRFGMERARVYDERRKPYGFKEFWRDLWSKDKDTL